MKAPDAILIDAPELPLHAVEIDTVTGLVAHPEHHGRALGHELEALLALAQSRLGPLLLRDVVALHEDAGDRAVVIEDRLVDEIEETLLGLLVRVHSEVDAHAATDEGLAAAGYAVEKIEEALPHHFGQRFADRLADELGPAHQRAVGGIREREDVVGTAEGRDEARRLLEQLAQMLPLLVQRLIDLLHRLGAAEQVGFDEARKGRRR